MNKKSKLYGNSDPLGSILSNWRKSVILRFLPKHGHIIDLACGDNRLVKSLHNQQATGIDITNYGNQADLVLPNFENLPFKSDSISAVTILAAINYFENPVACLKEISRVLEPQGILLITQLNPSLSKFWHIFRDRNLRRTAYSKEYLSQICEEANLRLHITHQFMLGVNNLYIFTKENLK